MIERPDQRLKSARLSRRQLLQGAGAVLGYLGAAARVGAVPDTANEFHNPTVEYGQATLPIGVRSRYIDNNNGVRMHVLEAGFEGPRNPCIVFLHGFPELAYTWRNQLLPVARAGFHAIAPDLRGYGHSVSVPVTYADDVLPYSRMNGVSDVVGLVRALGYKQVAAIVGHDWGSQTAAWCALVRPDIFRSVILVSTPFDGPPTYPLNAAAVTRTQAAEIDIDQALAALPRPRKHYASYWATRDANGDLWHAPQGVHDLLRALYYFKSADWQGNKPHPLKSWTATELAKMPEYYIMDLHKNTAQTMAAVMPSQAQIAACQWMTENDLQVYSTEYQRTGFQGGLNLYRVQAVAGDLGSFSGRTIDVPALYIAGASEWGVYQTPGAFEAMQHGACSRLQGVHLVNGAGHSVVEEQPEQVNHWLLQFLRVIASS
jgi:pimeloyl-ACP methyl ester carboxylesterase